jgi:PAS domain S-box-containing protein
MHGDATRLEHLGAGPTGNPALAWWTGHGRVMSMRAELASPGSPCQQAAILDAITEGVFTVDGQWRITSFNRAAEAITGIAREQALGQPCRTVFRASVCDGHCALRETMHGGTPIHGRRIEIIGADGNLRPVSVSTSLLVDGSGAVIGGVETFRDLRHEEALRKAVRKEAQLGDLVAVSPAMRRVIDVLPAIAGSSATVGVQPAVRPPHRLGALAAPWLRARADAAEGRSRTIPAATASCSGDTDCSRGATRSGTAT